MRGYFDHNATSPLRPEVAAVMGEVMAGEAGNPSSMHAEGRLARRLLDEARARVAALLTCPPEAVHFTSGATESNNLAIRGAAMARPGSKLVCSAAEHASVLDTVVRLGTEGRETLIMDVDRAARPDHTELARLTAAGPCLMAFGWANSESGHMADIDALVVAKSAGSLLHLDAAQAAGRVPVGALAGIDTIALSAHKFGGPRGVGALMAGQGSEPAPLMSGGPQEAGLRPGTENLAGIVGMGLAAELAGRELDAEAGRLGRLRKLLWRRLEREIPGTMKISAEDGLPGTLTVALAGTRAEIIVAALDIEGFAVSTGSACAAASPEPSHVMAALGVPATHRHGVLRMSMGWNTTEDEVEGLARAFAAVAERARMAA